MTTTPEQRTAVLLDTATSGLAPDVDHLVAGAVARGRVLRRRRRIGTTLAVAAVLGGIGAAASVSPALRGGAERAVDPPVASSPPPTPQPGTGAERRFGIDRHKTAAVLVSLLPGGTSEPLDAWGSDDPEDQYRDGLALHEGGQVAVHLEHPDLRDDDASPEQQCRRLPGAACRDLSGGEWYAVQQRAEPGPSPTIRSTTVTVFTRDGFALAATAWNAPGDRGVEPVQEEPVLEAAELLDVVLAPVWIDDQQ